MREVYWGRCRPQCMAVRASSAGVVHMPVAGLCVFCFCQSITIAVNATRASCKKRTQLWLQRLHSCGLPGVWRGSGAGLGLEAVAGALTQGQGKDSIGEVVAWCTSPGLCAG